MTDRRTLALDLIDTLYLAANDSDGQTRDDHGRFAAGAGGSHGATPSSSQKPQTPGVAAPGSVPRRPADHEDREAVRRDVKIHTPGVGYVKIGHVERDATAPGQARAPFHAHDAAGKHLGVFHHPGDTGGRGGRDAAEAAVRAAHQAPAGAGGRRPPPVIRTPSPEEVKRAQTFLEAQEVLRFVRSLKK